MLARRAILVAPDDDAGSLHDKLADLGAEEIVAVLAQVQRGQQCAVPQADAGASYAAKIRREETALEWDKPAAELERAVRARLGREATMTRMGG